MPVAAGSLDQVVAGETHRHDVEVPMPPAVSNAWPAGERYVRELFGIGEDIPLKITWSAWTAGLSEQGKVTFSMGSIPAVKATASLIGRVKIDDSDIELDIEVARKGIFTISSIERFGEPTLDGVRDQDVLGDLFGVPVADKRMAEILHRRPIDWTDFDLSPEISVSYKENIVRPQAIDLFSIRELGRDR